MHRIPPQVTASRIKPPTATFAFEMFGFLVIDQDLKVIKITLTVITPRASEDLLQVRVLPLGFDHLRIADEEVNRALNQETEKD